MPRRTASRPDSLELLLDTICNTFGGVLFIAILVVMLLQQSSTEPAEVSPKSQPLSSRELQTLTTRIDSITSELARMRANRDSQDAIVQSFSPPEIRQLLTDRRVVTSQQEALDSEAIQLLAENTATAAQIESLAEENQSVQTRLMEAKERAKAAAKKLDEERQSRVQEVRLPVSRSQSRKTEIGLVMRYGRLYVWHEYGAAHVRLGLNTKDFVILGEESGGLITRPNPMRGVVLNDSESSRQAVRNLLLQFDPKSCYLAVIVRPDCFNEFRYVRDRAIEAGFEYRLMPAGEFDPIADRGGTVDRVQ